MKNEACYLESRLAQKDVEINSIHGETATRIEKIQTESFNRAKNERDTYHHDIVKEAEAQYRKDTEKLERILTQQIMQAKSVVRKLLESAYTLKKNKLTCIY